jgi:hypothetical protein
MNRSRLASVLAAATVVASAAVIALVPAAPQARADAPVVGVLQPTCLLSIGGICLVQLGGGGATSTTTPTTTTTTGGVPPTG